MTRKNLADSIRVSSPCTEDWDQMAGNEKVRFCSHCDLEVNNLSAMSRKEALRFVRRSSGRICVRYIENPSANAPVFADRLYRIGRRAGIAAGVLGASLAVSTAAYAQGEVVLTAENPEPQTEIIKDKKAQSRKKEGGTGSISGTITDATGAVIPGAVVSLSGKDFNRTILSNDSGIYTFLQVPGGDYKLRSEASGFQTTNKEISVAAGKEIAANFALEVGEQFITMGIMVSIEYEQPLLRAVSEENFDEVTSIVARGRNVNVRDKNYGGITALFVAVESGNIKMVEALLNYGAKVNVRDVEKRTPLMSLDDDASVELVNLLLRYNAKVSAADRDGNNVLHYFAQNENAEIMRLLLKENADINRQNKEGQTPLMIAAYYENAEIVGELLRAGANVNLRDKENETALSIVKNERSEKAKEIVKLLVQYGAKDGF